jgi:hypothetical protein
MTEPGEDERGPVAAVARLFALQIAAVVGIAAAITVLAVQFGPDNSDVQAGLPAATSSAPEPSGTTASASPKASPSKTKRTRRSPSATATAPASPTETTSGSEAPASAKGPRVDVLNQSAGDGAGEATADALRESGWRIGRVADFNGTVRTTTVYYRDEDLQRDARRLARDLPGSVRVLEGFSTLSETRLSVVLVD